MSDVVVDSSVVAKWFVPEPDSPKAFQVLTDTSAANGRLIALDLMYDEVANVIGRSNGKANHPCGSTRIARRPDSFAGPRRALLPVACPCVRNRREIRSLRL